MGPSSKEKRVRAENARPFVSETPSSLRAKRAKTANPTTGDRALEAKAKFHVS
jgi:hypothetical protein